MLWFGLGLLTSLAVSCPSIDLREPVAGRLLITFGRADVSMSRTVCLLDGGVLTAAPVPAGARVRGADWGASPNEILFSMCEEGTNGRCHLERVSIDGQLLATYPPLPVEDFKEPDGRLTPGGATGPARVSPNGAMLAAAANGRSPALMRMTDGTYIAGLSRDSVDYVWSPDGTHLAYAKSPVAGRGALEESQLFIHDVASGGDVQLTSFPPAEYGSWWNPFDRPHVRAPLVSGLSWAPGANLILFYLAPDRGVYVWTPEGREVSRLDSLKGDCWRMTQLSADARRILYVSSTRPELCLLNGGNEVRLVDVDGSHDRVVLTTRSKDDVIFDVDWWRE